MAAWYKCRLTIIGPGPTLTRFDRHSDWIEKVHAQFREVYEHSKKRRVWWFDSEGEPLNLIGMVSASWPKLQFFLDYECEERRIKGLALAACGKIQRSEFTY